MDPDLLNMEPDLLNMDPDLLWMCTMPLEPPDPSVVVGALG